MVARSPEHDEGCGDIHTNWGVEEWRRQIQAKQIGALRIRSVHSPALGQLIVAVNSFSNVEQCQLSGLS